MRPDPVIPSIDCVGDLHLWVNVEMRTVRVTEDADDADCVSTPSQRIGLMDDRLLGSADQVSSHQEELDVEFLHAHRFLTFSDRFPLRVQ